MRRPAGTSAGAVARLVFALDVDRLAEAEALVRTLRGTVGVFKVGKQLFVAEGPPVVRMVHRHGGSVFLDLKFHDIPETTARAAVEAARSGVRFLDLHAAGGAAMMERTRAELARACRREGLARPAVLAVTVLTSLDDADLSRVGVAGGAAAQVRRLATLARRAGMDGVVASPREIAAVRRIGGPRFLVVTPGVRPAGAPAGDQKRVLGPAEAMAAGASHLVVGRPIRDAPDPRAAAAAIVAEIARGRRARASRPARSGRGSRRFTV